MLVKVGPHWINPSQVLNVSPGGTMHLVNDAEEYCVEIELMTGDGSYSIQVEHEFGLTVDEVGRMFNDAEETWLKKRQGVWS